MTSVIEEWDGGWVVRPKVGSHGRRREGNLWVGVSSKGMEEVTHGFTVGGTGGVTFEVVVDGGL